MGKPKVEGVEVKINNEFVCGGDTYRVTDVGTRVVVAINLSNHPLDHSWFNGPTYAVAEIVFDEDDLQACTGLITKAKLGI